jgi:hypothetical protein
VGAGSTKAEFVLVIDHDGLYEIPPWAATMTKSDFEFEYQLDTIEPVERLYGWGRFQTVIHVRDKEHGIRCTLFTTLEAFESIELSWTG